MNIVWHKISDLPVCVKGVDGCGETGQFVKCMAGTTEPPEYRCYVCESEDVIKFLKAEIVTLREAVSHWQTEAETAST